MAQWESRSYGEVTAIAYVVAARIAIGTTLLIAGLAKMRNPFLFLSDVYNYQLVGPTMGIVIVMVLPALEIMVALALLFGFYLRGAFALSALMAVIFTVATLSAIVRELGISCGCFSGSELGKIGYDTVIRTSLMFAAAITAYFLVKFRSKKQHDSHSKEISYGT